MDSGPIGRDAEIDQIRTLLAGAAGAPPAIVIFGDRGIGKTAVWKSAVQAATGACRVLSCRPAAAEAPLAFSALDDLLGGVIEEVLPALPEVPAHALESILLRDGGRNRDRDPRGRPLPERRVLARGVLDALRVLAADRPVLLAVDDAQWLDRPSADVLEFCIRRLGRAGVSLLLTSRGEDTTFPLGLDQALPPARLAAVRLGPLSRGALSEVLASRLGVTFPRHALARLHESCGGNPFCAIESARALLERGRTWPAHEPIPVPGAVGDLVRDRLHGLTGAALLVGRVTAASSDPREHVIRAACGEKDSWVAVDQAIDDGIIERDGDALRFTHPLLRSVLYSAMTISERRDVHRRLAACTAEAAERAWHLALGAEGPSDEIAAMLDEQARQAALTGAPCDAGRLQEQAVRLTPAEHRRQRRERVLRAADYHFLAGELARSRELIESALAECPAGSSRAPALLRLATIHYHQTGWERAGEIFRQAADEAPGDPGLRAHAEGELALTRLAAGDLAGASSWAAMSLRSAERADVPRLVAHCAGRSAVLEFLQGNPAQADLLVATGGRDDCPQDEPPGCPQLLGPSLARSVILKWSDRLDESRRGFADCYRHAIERGDEASLPFLLYHFSELECWAGNWDIAEEYAVEGCKVASESHQLAMRPAALYSLALVRALRGHVDDARESAAEALSLCERHGSMFLMPSVLSVLGFIALSLDDCRTAHAHFGRLAEVAGAAGLREPGVVRFLPDAIEALTGLGEISLARSYAARLQEQGSSLGRTWALATAARCRARIASVLGDHEGAQAACREALSAHERLPMPFELGRTLLVMGMTERRARRRSAASVSSGRALSIFEELGAPLWAARARAELSKTAARSLGGGLTATQFRVASLIASGQTNREIASAMFITENTVQTHLRHIFQKLGVRSRTELAVRILAASSGAGQPGCLTQSSQAVARIA